MAGERITKFITDQKTQETDIPRLLFGVVTSLSPLTIRFNENQMTIDANNFAIAIASTLKREKIGQHDNLSGFVDGIPLEIGERVIVERWNGGQQFFVKDRDI